METKAQKRNSTSEIKNTNNVMEKRPKEIGHWKQENDFGIRKILHIQHILSRLSHQQSIKTKIIPNVFSKLL